MGAVAAGRPQHALDDVQAGWLLDWHFLVTQDALHTPTLPNRLPAFICRAR
jgi:hypothetical protein